MQINLAQTNKDLLQKIIMPEVCDICANKDKMPYSTLV